jgi:hypothetical protein
MALPRLIEKCSHEINMRPNTESLGKGQKNAILEGSSSSQLQSETDREGVGASLTHRIAHGLRNALKC